MEAEIVAMVVNMYNGGPKACGTTTSGGTESILMAVKTMRDWARETKGITEPEMVIPVTAHAAFDKAGNYFGVKVFHAPVEEESRKVNVNAVRRMVTRNTIMVRKEAVEWAREERKRRTGLGKRKALGKSMRKALGKSMRKKALGMRKAGRGKSCVLFLFPWATSFRCHCPPSYCFLISSFISPSTRHRSSIALSASLSASLISHPLTFSLHPCPLRLFARLLARRPTSRTAPSTTSRRWPRLPAATTLACTWTAASAASSSPSWRRLGTCAEF